MQLSTSNRSHLPETNGPDAVVFVLLDAFRHDYLERTRFLSDISRRSLLGRLEEPFGFCPRAAYFGGLTPGQQGFTNLLHFDPVRSVFRWTREFAGTALDSEVAGEWSQDIRARAREELPEFSAAFVDALGIPLEYLAYFDVSERHAPWDDAVGYRSLFHILNEHDRRWLEVSWPYLALPRGVTNSTVAGEALERLEPGHAFAYLHLPSLDSLGHRHGPGSVVVQRAIEETDRLCEMIVGRMLEIYRDPVVAFAGDHGMIPVIRRVDVWGALAATSLRFGREIVFFVDSTMVRCWFLTARARQLSMDALAALRCGRWITAEDRGRWGLDGLPTRNGEEYFLADPGIVFAPSFFVNDPERTPRGMHGYAPDIVDNQAVFIAHRPRGCWSGDVGVVEARRLFPSFLRWLGWDSKDFTEVPPITEHDGVRRPARWTRSGNADVEATVTGHMQECVHAIRERTKKISAVVLTGGFGRGEGTATAEAGVVQPRNDYDLIVVGDGKADFGSLGETLAGRFAIDFVDLGKVDRLIAPATVSQAAFDLRYGSRVLWGDPLVLERLPRYAPEEVGSDEGVYLLGNRFCGLVLALAAEPGHGHAAPSFFMHQLAKFLIAVVDVWLIDQRDYHARYEVRRRRFADLACAAGFDRDVVAQIEAGFAYKLDGELLDCDPQDGVGRALRVFEELARVSGWRDARTWFGQRLRSVITGRGKPAPSWIDRVEPFGLRLRPESRAEIEVARSLVYEGCVAAVYGFASEQRLSAKEWQRLLGSCWELTPAFGGARSVSMAWLAQFH